MDEHIFNGSGNFTRSFQRNHLINNIHISTFSNFKVLIIYVYTYGLFAFVASGISALMNSQFIHNIRYHTLVQGMCTIFLMYLRKFFKIIIKKTQNNLYALYCWGDQWSWKTLYIILLERRRCMVPTISHLGSSYVI